jgi:hypothetical protein
MNLMSCFLNVLVFPGREFATVVGPSFWAENALVESAMRYRPE